MPEAKIDRPLSPLLPRDCGHECRVCKVTVASLTDYAGHISSPEHKQKVEDFERKPARSSSNEKYFDQALVELIEKRNEQIRKEKEAAAAKLAQQEAERKRKEEFQQRLNDAKDHFRLDWQPNPHSNQCSSWHRGKQYSTGPQHMQNNRPWEHDRCGKSATWHAQVPPKFNNCNNFNKGRPPWISNAGSSHGVYGCNTISQSVRPMSLLGPSYPHFFPSLPKFHTKGLNQFQKQAVNQGSKPKNGLKTEDKPNSEAEPNNKSNKSCGSNPKLDKTCRWSPYNVNKAFESMPNLVQKNSKQKWEKSADIAAPKSEKSHSSGASSNNSSRSSSLQRDGQKSAPSPNPSTQKSKITAQQSERRASLGASGSSEGPAKSSSPNDEKLKFKNGLSYLSKSDRQLPETLKKTKQLEKKHSLDSLSNIGQKTLEHVQVGVNKENNLRQSQSKPSLPVLSKPAVIDKLGFPDPSLQHLQVSTSSVESPESTVLNQHREEHKHGIEHVELKEKRLASTEEYDASKTSDLHAQSSGLSNLDLLPGLKRDLTKNMSSNKAKVTVSLEPNLHNARRIRNLSGSKKSDSEKDTGLKPTVRQLISSSGSRRKVNWEQVYSEVRKKQDKGKGMPRFGIEMVPLDQQGNSQEEDDLHLLQGFHWESLLEPVTPPTATSRKRSLSESSAAPTSNPAQFLSDAVIKSEPQEPSQVQREMEMLLGLCEDEETQQDVNARQKADSVFMENSSGNEMCDSQGTAKKRRAAAVDLPQPETSSLEHNNKRRKIKSKKERFHIDQLLVVSLREDELSQSLQSLDTDLIKARAALEAAYAEVHRLMMVKQQMTAEMDTLRSKRIELLKGMQDIAPEVSVKVERLDYPDLHLSTATESSASLCGTRPAHSTSRASPPAPTVPFTPVTIKEEPRSPVHVSSERSTPHSTTAELPTAYTAPEKLSKLSQRLSEPERDDFGDLVDSKASLAELVQSMERKNLMDPSSTDNTLGSNRRGSGTGTFAESAGAPCFVPPEFTVPTSLPEARNGKKVRKLKKRKALKKASGAELPESSDTEIDTEATRPKWVRNRRRSSGGSQVSTSNQQTEDREDEVKMQQETEEPKDATKEVTAESELGKTNTGEDRNPNSFRHEAHPGDCREVSSTSDMDISPAPESDVQVNLTLPKVGKTSTDISSDHGEDDLPTEGAFEGHIEAVNSMQIYNGLLYTCSGDRTVRVFDVVSHKCVAVLEGHSSKVNALLVSTNPSLCHRLYTGSSDQTIRCYSLTTQKFEEHFSLSDRVLCLHSRWKTLYAGLGNGSVVTIDLKTNRQTDLFECHGPRAVSCLASSQEGARRLLLVGSYDSTISVRDAKNGLLLRTLEGHSKTVLCMKVVNDLVFSGSSDQCIYAHNIHSGQLVRVYKGHSHAVSVVCVQGKVMVTACLDKLVRVYDLQTHEQLQVYGGHKDMVMCMTIHKNMIYTGCYDGSVQAVKLNLMQNFHCRWHGCSLVFGVLEHLEQHLSHDHFTVNLKNLRCRWKNCEEFFKGPCISSKGARLVHMQKHAAEESQVEP